MQSTEETHVPTNVPEVFATTLFWPKPKAAKGGKRQPKHRVPSVATSDKWDKYHESVEEEKDRKKREIEERKNQRAEAAAEKKRMQEELKLRKQQERAEKKRMAEDLKTQKKKQKTRSAK